MVARSVAVIGRADAVSANCTMEKCGEAEKKELFHGSG